MLVSFTMLALAAPSPAGDGGTLPEGCDASIPVEALTSTIADATGAFAGLDLQGYEEASERTSQQLPCVSGTLTPLDVADVFKVRALDAFLDQRGDEVEQHLRAARIAAPDYRLPASIAPRGHPLRAAFEAAGEPTDGGQLDLPVPEEARLLVDGQPVLSRPADRAALVQLVRVNGSVSWTRMVTPEESLPVYPSLGEEFRDRYLNNTKVIRVRPRRPIELVVAASAALVASGTLYALSRSSRSKFDDPVTPYADLPGLRARTNGLQTAAVLTAVGGLGLGVTAAVTW